MTENQFSTLLQNPLLLQNLTEKMGFTAPTPIQLAAIPLVLQAKDVYAGAKTGSGKTVAFLAPIAQRIFKGEIERAIVLAPTRELVLQMDEEAMRLLDGQTDLVSVPLYGGVPIDPQILALKHHRPKILIGTPGRVLDLLQEGALQLSGVQVAVLDEADRMCDMGFAPQVTQILDHVVDLKQTLLFSATLPKELNDIMSRYCPTPERVQVDAADESSETIEHKALFLRRKEKLNRLRDILNSDPAMIAVIFTKTRNRADEIYDRLRGEGAKIGVLHAGLPMPERERTLKLLKEGKIQHLIATDVFARGIDVDTITHVIHYDLPFGLDEYIHRSGRSGRAGRTGTSIAFVESDSSEQTQLFKTFMNKIKVTPWEGSKIPAEGAAESRTERGPRQYEDRDRGPRRRPEGDRRPPRRRRPDSDAPAQHRGPRPAQSASGSHARRPSAHAASPAKAGPAKKTGIVSKAKSLIKKVFGKKEGSSRTSPSSRAAKPRHE